MYPGWANGIGWLIAMTAILSVPIAAIVTVVVAYRKRPEEGLLAALNRSPAFLFFCQNKALQHPNTNLTTFPQGERAHCRVEAKCCQGEQVDCDGLELSK